MRPDVNVTGGVKIHYFLMKRGIILDLVDDKEGSMYPPTYMQISEKLMQVVMQIISREQFQDWAEIYILNDDSFEVIDHICWNYLVHASVMCETDYVGNYIYTILDIKDLIKEYDYAFYSNHFR